MSRFASKEDYFAWKAEQERLRGGGVGAAVAEPPPSPARAAAVAEPQAAMPSLLPPGLLTPGGGPQPSTPPPLPDHGAAPAEPAPGPGPAPLPVGPPAAEQAALAAAEKKIRAASTAGIVVGCVTLLAIIVAQAVPALDFIDAWALIDVALVFGLAWGIRRKSRACAVALLVYYVASKILMMAQTGKPSGILIALLISWYLVQGVQGTFEHRRLRRAGAA